MSLDATDAGASSDSYVSVADADTYHANRLHNSEWSASTTDTKERALKWATQLMENESWRGSLSTATQALRWPRKGVYNLDGVELSSSSIPDWLKSATSEYALELIKSNRPADPETAGIRKMKVDVIELEFDKNDRNYIMPESVFTIIRSYLLVSAKKVLRV